MSDAFDWYRAALRGETPPVHENEPQCGYFRVRRGKGGPWVPVAMWAEDGKLVGHYGDDYTDDADKLCEWWTYACRNPVAYDIYAKAMRGEGWPDDIAEPAIRSNADAHTQLSEAIRELIEAAKRELEGADLTDPTTRDKAANYATRVVELGGQANAAREDEKRPFLEGGRNVDEKWRGILDEARGFAKDLKGRIGDALKIVAARSREAGASEVATKAGTRGKSVSLRTRKRTVVDDPIAAATWLLTNIDPPPFELLEGLAKAAVRLTEAGAKIPGVRTEVEEYAA